MVEILNEKKQEEIFSRMAAEIETLDDKTTKIQKLVSEMQRCEENTFTPEELSVAVAYYNTCFEQSQTLRSNLSTKIELYEKTILAMNRQLSSRQTIIEKFEQEGAINEGDELYDLLVQNHARLSAELKEHTKHL